MFSTGIVGMLQQNERSSGLPVQLISSEMV